ncbi:sperm acrosome-associated protein 5 isoform X3 [Canis lupus baileyi]|uniref:Sperm acrosome associated 5 n=2 Tax=Canis lupus familiaris TaxID=9615 RepID=A0A8C0N7Z1_CANLF|nr:sperm acrosome-associated protein 5 isoform X3 [Canis lupus familiaris]XP_025324740.1 sperm acrosome-associated protein 5 isoform X3 [Canis lupus dingo]XP_038305857.1 sperm acrosome-associated protein 5 isoform X3 [Canis lupus familiaris]XP_038443260.1 sperm acrosome-associated protein 5 isoform X3 [Canis lupus familiaris]|eukprot:XP_005641352.1 sperm acrosome-associated protein 5 isoform X3 [Canis lupus familiaris]
MGVIMQAWVTMVVTLATLTVAPVDAKIYERCELAMKLEKAGLNGFKGYSIEDWLCMAHYESGFDTSFVDHNPDGSSEYGIFQLNSAWWCNNGVTPTQNLCHMECRDLLNRHILDDILCARQVASSKNGMTACPIRSRHPREEAVPSRLLYFLVGGGYSPT